VIVTGATPVTRAAKAASTTVPIVFVIGADPVKVGVVASLNRPGENVTGVSFLANSLLGKQFEVLHEQQRMRLGENCLSFKPAPIATLRQPSPRS
jgi:putative tryptophan/tyrosine transport system substrate-binding protein